MTYLFAALKTDAKATIKMKVGGSFHIFICEDVNNVFSAASSFDAYSYYG